LPQADLVRSESGGGGRAERPDGSCDFLRDVFASGRLYEVLLRAKVRGLMTPEDVVASRLYSMADSGLARSWVNAKIRLLEAEALV